MERRSFPESAVQAYRWGIAGVVAIVFTTAVEMVENSDELGVAIILAILFVVISIIVAAALDYWMTNRIANAQEY